MLQFENCIEGWETERISLSNDKCRSSLLNEYEHMYLFDEGKVRRVTDVVWSTNTRPTRHQVVTTFVGMLDADDSGDRRDVN